MRLLNTQNRINQLLTVFVTQVKGAASFGRTDINLVSENVLVPLLAEVYDIPTLRNLNFTEESNYPGIDLADDVARIAFQVTASPGSEKVKETLRKFVSHELYNKYDRVIIYILTEKQKSYSGAGYADIIEGRFHFDPEKDVCDYRDILKRVASFPIDRAQKVARILEDNFGIENHSALVASYFRKAEDEFETLVSKNFLFEFNGPTSNYLELLSNDFRSLFFKFFNELNRNNLCNRICVVGREGVGKSFNALLIGLLLQQQDYIVYYAEDTQHPSLPEALYTIMRSFSERSVFIIDNCQKDDIATENIVKNVTTAKGYTGKPRFIFLSRPLDSDDMNNIYGKTTPVVTFRDAFVDLEKLTALFFDKINMPQALPDFLSTLKKHDLSQTLFQYRNTAFWNEFFNAMEESPKIELDQTLFYQLTSRFLRKREPYFFQHTDVLMKLLPFFVSDLGVNRDYALHKLQLSTEHVNELVNNGIISVKEQHWVTKTWENDTAMFIVSKFHQTKAKIITSIFEKYEHAQIDKFKAITSYAASYYENLYHILSPLRFDSEALKQLIRNEDFVSLIKQYFRERRLGKQLDRVIRALSQLGSESKDKIIDGEILESFAEKLNDDKPFIVNKLYLFLAMYKFSPQKSFELYKRFDKTVLAQGFINIPDETGVYSFAKFMEVFKNIYYFVKDEEEKTLLITEMKQILDCCSDDFVNRFNHHFYFTHFHWFLKRLDGMKLDNYFLSKVPPETILHWIKTKDVNTVELRFVFKGARYTQIVSDLGGENLYDYLKRSLNYTDAEKIFNNKRSKLYDIVITSKFGHEILASYLYQYSKEGAFAVKISTTNNLFIINEAMDLVAGNAGLDDNQKQFIIQRIVANTRFGEAVFKATIRAAIKLHKQLDIDQEKERFQKYAKGWG